MHSNAKGRWTKCRAGGLDSPGDLSCFAANFFYCLRLPILSNARRRWTKCCAEGLDSLGGLCCFASNSFYSLWLPIQSNAKGGEQNAVLEVYIVLGDYAASQQTLFNVSGSPTKSTVRGEVNQRLCWTLKNISCANLLLLIFCRTK